MRLCTAEDYLAWLRRMREAGTDPDKGLNQLLPRYGLDEAAILRALLVHVGVIGFKGGEGEAYFLTVNKRIEQRWLGLIQDVAEFRREADRKLEAILQRAATLKEEAA